jgi:hypothetical protein
VAVGANTLALKDLAANSPQGFRADETDLATQHQFSLT